MPYCRTTRGARQTSDTGRIQAWACDHCDTDWTFTVPDSRTVALLGDLGAAAEEIGRLRWTLRLLSPSSTRLSVCARAAPAELGARRAVPR
jgi:hypothetical protein